MICAVFTACLWFGVYKRVVEEEEIVKKNIVICGKCKNGSVRFESASYNKCTAL